MNTRIKHTIAITIAALLLCGCTASKYLKKAAQFELAGLYEQAAKAYIVSLDAKSDNVKAIVGLKNAGQRAVEEKSALVQNAADHDDLKTAVYQYLDMADMVNKSAKFGVLLKIPEQITSAFEDTKQRYAEQIYGQAQQMLDAERYQQAETLLKELKQIAPNHSDDVDEMLMLSKAEPQYQSAQQQLQQKKYRKAYTTLSDLVKAYPSYKDASELQAEALNHAMITIRVEDFGTQRSRAPSDYAQTLRANVMSAISAKNNVFVKIVDGQAQALQEQRRAIAVGANVISLGQLLAAKALLQGNITGYNIRPASTSKTVHKGYLRKEIKRRNKETGEETVETTYEKVTYEHYTTSASASITLSYQLVSVETGEVLLSNVAQSTKSDEASYITFSGDCKQLVPGNWEHANKRSDKDKISTDNSEIKNVQRKCGRKPSISSTTTLLNQATKAVCESVANKINAYNPEK